MTGSNINVNLLFNANTQQARNEIKNLQTSLNSIVTSTNKQAILEGADENIRKANQAAIELKASLQAAMNPQTGQLDLSKFSAILKASGKDLNYFKDALSGAGTQGVQAFQQLTKSITIAEIPLKKTNVLVDKLWASLKNVATWQVSSAILQGFTGAISDAYRYAQDLNKSLNDIRIVTGYSAEEMEKFAVQANKSAKALSTTTKEYARASLIYFQQGLTDQQVKERTDITVKMANVTGTTAQEVSDQMTAVWNNFYDGSKSLEYYADVMTALGAATASSTDEISEGLNKFAAVAETVGLSYEYSASALATLTATTRESADIVGNALKTLFARIQGLKLGETLEDGVTLNKYSTALEKVGIDILDANDNMKEMDTILDELGSKWDTISKSEQTALAQTVAGVRQYTQLIALMENWDYFQENLGVASGAEGALQEQADIYAESWEAALERVTAALETIYDKLIEDDFFIDLANAATGFLEVLSKVIDSVGGLQGVLSLIGILIPKIFGTKIINEFANSFQGTVNRTVAMDLRKTAVSMQASTLAGSREDPVEAAKLDALQKREKFLQTILGINRQLTKVEEDQITKLVAQHEELQKQAELQGKMLADNSQKRQEAENQVSTAQKADKKAQEYKNQVTEETQSALRGRVNFSTVESAFKQVDGSLLEAQSLFDNFTNAMPDKITDIKSSITTIFETLSDEGKQELAELEAELDQIVAAGGSTDDIKAKITERFEGAKSKVKANRGQKAIDIVNSSRKKSISKDDEQAILKLNAAQQQATESSTKLVNAQINYNAVVEETAEIEDNAAAEASHMADEYDGLQEELDKIANKPPTLAEGFMSAAQSASSFAMALTTLTSIVDIWTQDNDLTLGEKFGQTLMSLTMAIPMLITGLQSASVAMAAFKGTTVMTALSTGGLSAATAALTASLKNSTLATIGRTIAEKLSIPIKAADTAATGAQTAANWALLASLGPIGIAILAIMATLLAAVAVIAIITAAVKGLSDAYNADAIAAENAAKKAEEVATAYENTKSAYDALKESIQDYHDSQAAIDKLKEGTEEWRDAIQAVNDQVLELIDTYPELAQYVSNKDGRLVISDEGLKAIDKIYEDRTNTLYNQKLDTDLDARKVKARSTRTDLVRGELDTFNDGLMIAGAILSATSFGPGLASATIIENQKAANRSEQALEDLSKLYAQEGNAIFANLDATLDRLNIKDEKLITALKENEDAVRELCEAEKLNLELERQYSQAKVDNLLASQGFSSEHYTGNIQDRVREQYESEIAKAKEQVGNTDDWTYQKWYALGIATGGTQEGENAAKQYARLMGIEQDFDVTDFEGKQLKYKYTDAEGNEQTGSVTYEQMQKTLAEYAVNQSDAILQYAQRMTSTIISLEQTGSKESAALASFLEEGNLSYVAPEQYEAIAQGNLAAMFPKGTDLTQVAKDFGYESIEALQTAIANAPYDAEQALANIARRTTEEVNAIFEENAEALGTTTEALEAYAAHLIATNEGLEEDKKLAAQVAVQQFKMAKGLNSLQKAFRDNAQVLREANENSIDYYEALGEVSAAVEETFGLKVDAQFVKDNLTEIEAMANGDVEALEHLRSEINKEFILNLNISDSAKNILNDTFAELSAMAENAEIGTQLKLDNSGAIAAINEALATGAASIKDIEAMFNNANLQMPEYHEAVIPGNPVVTRSSTTYTGPLGLSWSAESVSSTTTDRTIPYFGDAKPTVNESGQMDYGKSNSVAVSTTGNTTSSTAMLDYEGEDGSDKDPKSLKLEDEIDRYHEIKEVISDIERELDALGKAKNRAFGADKLRLMDKEIAKNKELLQAQKDYVSQIENKFAGDRNTLLGFGASTDSEGRITNYEELRTNWVNWYNESIQNIAGDSEKEQEIQDRYDAFTKAIDQYEESLNLLESEQQKIIDLQNEIFDQKLEKIEYKVEIKTELADDEIKWLEYELEHIEDLAWNAATAIAKLGDIADQNAKKVEAYHEGLAEVFKLTLNEEEMAALMSGDLSVLDDKTLTEGQIEALKNYRDALYDSNAALEEFYNNIEEQSVSAFEMQNEEMEKSISQIEHLNSILDAYANIVDLVGKKNLGLSSKALRELGRAQVEAAQSALRATKIQLDSNRAQLLEAQEQRKLAIENNASEETIEYWDNIIETIGNKVVELEETVNDQWVNALQAAANDFERAVDTVMESFEESMSGIYSSFDAMEEAYNQQKEISERYLADYEQIYNLSKLNRDISKSINDTDSIRAKGRLRDIQEEINALQESNAEMTQYEVDELRARYELRLAEIALEDAQNAKSQVRMQRDAEGNWSYVYTADQNKVDSALQNYEDKLYAYQQLTQGYIDEMEDQIIGLPREYADKMREIAADVTLTEDERKVKMQELTDFYSGKYRYLYDELNKALGDSKALYEEDWNQYSEYTGYKIALDSGEGGWRDSFNETALAQITGYENIETARSAFDEKVTEMLPRLSQAFKDWKADVDEAMRGAGKALNGDEEGSFKKELETTVKNTNDELSKVESSLSGLGTKATQAFQAMTKAIADEFKNYEANLAPYKKANEEIIQQINQILNNKLDNVSPEQNSTNNNNYTHSGDNGTSLKDKKPEISDSDYDNNNNNKTTPRETVQGYWSSKDAANKQGAYTGLDINTLDSHMKNFIYHGSYSTMTYGGQTWYLSIEDTKKLMRLTHQTPRVEADPPYEINDVAKINSTTIYTKSNDKGTEMITNMPENISKTKFHITRVAPGNWYEGYLESAPNQIFQVYKDYLEPFYNLSDLKGFDTGGYTGSWGSNGRLAMLHQKELVLNADDTAKFLSAIEIVRNISRIIDLRVAEQQSALGAISGTTIVPSAQTLQQDVVIHAEFPNATNRTEIEKAFDSLLNRASQFANRKI